MRMLGSSYVNSKRTEAIRDLKTRQVLFSCEGKAERVVIETLSEANALVVPNQNIVRDMDGRPCTLLRKAKDIQREFLGVDYPDGLLIARIVDVNPGVFRLDRPYRLLEIKVFDFITRPEIEALVLAREGELDKFRNRRGHDRQLNASDWCIQKLRIDDVKGEEFLKDYWSDADDLVRCIREAYSKLGSHKKEQLGLADLLK